MSHKIRASTRRRFEELCGHLNGHKSHIFRNIRRCSSQVRSPKLRFAPSPTGYLHLGGLRTALFNHLLARKLGGTWVLRIEDTDQTRYVEGAVESLLRTLQWSQLEYDEGPQKDGGRGPYFQSQRKAVYDRYLEPLIKQGKAYHCFCSSERLAETRKLMQKKGSNATYDRRCLGLSQDEVENRLSKGEQSVIRFKSSAEGLTQHDLVYAPIHYETLPVEDFVLRKSDGLPTYHFANVVDDWEMGITHVLRGEEWLPSTPKHLALYKALGLDPPSFAHLPLLINPDGSKLSKRAGDVRVEDYIAKGYEPEALLNFVALLGWSPQAQMTETPDASPDDTDVLSMDQLINQFSIEGVNKNRATLSITKLDSLNRAHLQRKLLPGAPKLIRNDLEERALAVMREGEQENEPGTETAMYAGRVLEALKERLYTIRDIPTLGPYFYTPPDLNTKVAQQMIKSDRLPASRDALKSALAVLESLPPVVDNAPLDGSAEQISIQLNALVDPNGGKSGIKAVMTPLRWALTGQKVGAGVPATIAVLGLDRAQDRLRRGLEWIESNEKKMS